MMKAKTPQGVWVSTCYPQNQGRSRRATVSMAIAALFLEFASKVLWIFGCKGIHIASKVILEAFQSRIQRFAFPGLGSTGEVTLLGTGLQTHHDVDLLHSGHRFAVDVVTLNEVVVSSLPLLLW